MKKIYLVRHGQTNANAEEYVPSKEEPLNDNGVMQAGALSERLANIDFDKIIVSDFLRAQQTAEAISKLKGIIPEVHPAFGEMLEPTSLYGVVDTDERVQKYRSDRNNNVEDSNWRFEDGDNFNDVLGRVFVSKDILETDNCERILVVTHGYFSQIFTATILLGIKKPSKEWFHTIETLKNSNTAISLFTFDDKKWKLMLWNDHAHFAE